MIVSVRMFARARDLAGSDVVRVNLAEGATVAELRRQLGLAVPAVAGLAERSAIGVNDEFAIDTTPLTERDKVALLPPVSGGAW